MVTLNQKVLKIVIQAEINKNETQVRNYLTNVVWPKLETKIDTKMDNNFDPGWSKEVSLRVTKGPGNWIEAYPKFMISGETPLTAEQLKISVSDLLADLKITLKADFESQGATNITFHVHYEDGRQSAVDET
jgi:hypothetical protein